MYTAYFNKCTKIKLSSHLIPLHFKGMEKTFIRSIVFSIVLSSFIL